MTLIEALNVSRKMGATYFRDYYTVTGKLLVRHFFNVDGKEVVAYNVVHGDMSYFSKHKKWIKSALKYLTTPEPIVSSA